MVGLKQAFRQLWIALRTYAFHWRRDLIGKHRHVYLSTDVTDGRFNYRGVVATEDETRSFARMMARRGLTVRVVKFYRGPYLER